LFFVESNFVFEIFLDADYGVGIDPIETCFGFARDILLTLFKIGFVAVVYLLEAFGVFLV
jgi:hypothetical protein